MNVAFTHTIKMKLPGKRTKINKLTMHSVHISQAIVDYSGIGKELKKLDGKRTTDIKIDLVSVYVKHKRTIMSQCMFDPMKTYLSGLGAVKEIQRYIQTSDTKIEVTYGTQE